MGWNLQKAVMEKQICYGKAVALKLSIVKCTGVRRDYTLKSDIEKETMWCSVSMNWVYEAFTELCYIGVVVVRINSIAEHIVLSLMVQPVKSLENLMQVTV